MSASSRWLGRVPPRVMPYSGASTEYCAWVSPYGASAASIAARQRMDSRQIR
jgi:hypothetical protein